MRRTQRGCGCSQAIRIPRQRCGGSRAKRGGCSRTRRRGCGQAVLSRPAHHEISIPLAAFGTALPGRPTRPPVLSSPGERTRSQRSGPPRCRAFNMCQTRPPRKMTTMPTVRRNPKAVSSIMRCPPQIGLDVITFSARRGGGLPFAYMHGNVRQPRPTGAGGALACWGGLGFLARQKQRRQLRVVDGAAVIQRR